MTYSLVARDPETGELGVAVQSHFFSVGLAAAGSFFAAGSFAAAGFLAAAGLRASCLISVTSMRVRSCR